MYIIVNLHKLQLNQKFKQGKISHTQSTKLSASEGHRVGCCCEDILRACERIPFCKEGIWHSAGSANLGNMTWTSWTWILLLLLANEIDINSWWFLLYAILFPCKSVVKSCNLLQCMRLDRKDMLLAILYKLVSPEPFVTFTACVTRSFVETEQSSATLSWQQRRQIATYRRWWNGQ